MSDNSCDRVVSAISKAPWAIMPDALEVIIGIAQRKLSDKEAVLSKKAERPEGSKVLVRDGVAIIPVMGPIFPRADIFTQISGATSVEAIALKFGEAVASPDIKAIVLHVDSPGGQITGINEFANQVYAARDMKPVVAYVSGVGASAAYWIASATSKVAADETAELGSIGVVAAWTDDKEARKSAGLKDYEVVSSQSPNKRIDLDSRDGRAVLQQKLDTLADMFIGSVARNRGKRASTVEEQFGQGGTLFARDAVRVGMADKVSSLEDVISELSGKPTKGGLLMANEKEMLIGASASVSKKEDEEKQKCDDEATEDEKVEEKAKKKAKKKAADDTEEEKDKEEEDAKSAFMRGVLQERSRMQAIDELPVEGNEQLINEAKYKTPCSAEALAVRILKAQRVASASFAEKYKADAKSISVVPGSAPTPKTEQNDTASATELLKNAMLKRGYKKEDVANA